MNLNIFENVELSVIAEWKIKLLEYGIDTEVDFKELSDANLYRMKLRKMEPVSNNFKVVDVEEDQGLVPSEILISDDNNVSIVKLRYNPQSPFLLSIVNFSKGTIQIKEKNNGCITPIKASLVPAPSELKTHVQIGQELIEINVYDYVSFLGMDRISIVPYDGCWNWNQGIPCKFCDLHPKRNLNMSTFRPTLNDLDRFDYDSSLWWKYYSVNYYKCLEASLKLFFEETKLYPHLHLMIMAGNLSDSKVLWNICESIINIVNKYVNIKEIDSYLNISPHNDIEDLIKLKEKGLKQVQYNLEISNKERFKDVCFGKMSYEEIKEKLFEAVNVMGKGNVRSNFVFGLQPIDELIEDILILSAEGIVCDYSIFQPKRGTPYANRSAPRMEDIITFSKKLAAIYKYYEYKPIFCSVSSRSSIINELMEQFK